LRKLLVKRLKEGMCLAEDISNYRGETLLYAGTELNELYIRRLQKLGLSYVQVHSLEESQQKNLAQGKSSLFNRQQTADGVSNQVREEACILVQDICGEIEQTGKLKEDHLIQTKEMVEGIIQEIVDHRIIIENLEDYKPVNQLVDELITQEEIFANVEGIRVYDEYTFIHCVDVCVMSIILGKALGYHKVNLTELGIGALLHDIGKVRIAKEIINKPGKLTEEERKEIERHTEYTFQILQECHEISLLSALIAYQHHERFDGHGYPQGLKGTKIQEYSKIVAVADVYDALVTDRSYRPGMWPYEAAEIIQASSGRHFDPGVVKSFLDNIVIYPVGSPIELNNKTRGIVTKINKMMPSRPVVLIFYDQKGNLLGTPQTLDLTQNLTLFIKKVFRV